ncbi:hypothetical protein CONCODRAFT_13930 [Conidiobolus coronatus NRRL 28638]|uniref:Uncharacterized protein n=1 Tax=Conidiobolus coronatus (strain ATCC 28846 / CBS 209.66 / NRRL 28638) TaxID=796925 RepID=A0A137NQ05_CONC2|nr:hypothetical protein CONCODRAFT_13930 [Conidiobolus coronatus NRRL 28638]|eukprot:KXN64784.1 hypothetical protein CONCODRAFT_13930 [Conidiobolus coronatus NRRL 28638]
MSTSSSSSQIFNFLPLLLTVFLIFTISPVAAQKPSETGIGSALVTGITWVTNFIIGIIQNYLQLLAR